MNIGQILAFDCRSKCDAVSEQTTNDVRDGQEKPTHVARARDLGDTNTPVKPPQTNLSRQTHQNSAKTRYSGWEKREKMVEWNQL